MGLFEERSVLARRNRTCKCPEVGARRPSGWSRGQRGCWGETGCEMHRAGTPGTGGQKGLDFVSSVTRHQPRALSRWRRSLTSVPTESL